METTRQDVPIPVFLVPAIHTIYVMVIVAGENLSAIVLSIMRWKQYVLPWITSLMVVTTLVIAGGMFIIWQSWGLAIYFINLPK
jgi:hypothetical protein